MSGFFSMLLNRPSIRDRRFERSRCELPATLAFPDRGYDISGMLLEISQGGALFREASSYILDRRRTPIVVRTGAFEFPGVIVNVRPAGYGIRFDMTITPETIAEVLAESAYPNS